MIKKRVYGLFIFFFVSAQSFALPLSRSDIEQIVRQTKDSQSLLVRKAFAEEDRFRKATQNEIEKLLGLLAAESSAPIFARWDRVMHRLKHDYALVQKLNHEFSKFQVPAVTWSCKTNKLVEILEEAIRLFESEGTKILAGELPREFVGYWDTPRSLDGHNGRELALKAILIVGQLESKDEQSLNQIYTQESLDKSAFVHTTPLPKNLFFQEINRLTFFYNGTKSGGQEELGFVHGGYAFGGQRNDVSYLHFGPFGKPLGPQDCSSWISKLIGARTAYSTVDFLTREQVFLQKLIPMPVQAVQDVRPGMILLTRKYDVSVDPTMSMTVGTSGHILLVVDVRAEDQTLVTLEYNRDLPRQEGFGMRRIPFNAADNVKPIYFELP